VASKSCRITAPATISDHEWRVEKAVQALRYIFYTPLVVCLSRSNFYRESVAVYGAPLEVREIARSTVALVGTWDVQLSSVDETRSLQSMRLEHGYTNVSMLEGSVVTKQFQGSDALERLTREAAALGVLSSYVAVPEVLHVDPAHHRLQTRYIPSRHGQAVIDTGEASEVLFLCGMLLHHLQTLSPQLLPNAAGFGPVIVHGDFGPQNMLIASDAWRVTALVDWEWVHVGQPVEDLAWAEWIVRSHHPHAVRELTALFRGFGDKPAWKLRHDAMVEQCYRLLAYVEQQEQPDAVVLWKRRLEATERFVEKE
jgi:aminoglycoside phosphotransferase